MHVVYTFGLMINIYGLDDNEIYVRFINLFPLVGNRGWCLCRLLVHFY